jgi:NAD(P)H-hydrate epimerase
MAGLHPPLRPYARVDVLAPTGAESAALDQTAIEGLGVPQPVLMENAGRSAASIVQRLFPEGRVVGVVGSGNNGGDALVLLRTLRAWGRDVGAVLVAERIGVETGSDPLLHGWDIPIQMDHELDAEGWRTLFGGAGLIVDGVLGTGVRGAPRERASAAIEHVNRHRSGCPVLALDVPSGIDAATGAMPGSAVQATVTVAFGAPKLGSLFHPARALVGRLIAVEIAFPPGGYSDTTARLITPAWAQARLPVREPDTHKNAVGRVLVVAGQQGMAGAAVLAVRAAFGAGAGLVRVCSATENREILQASVPEAIYVDPLETGALLEAMERCDAIGFGPGLGTGSFARESAALLTNGPSRPVVVDADGLNLVARGDLDLTSMAATRAVLATPHAGEMARLLDTDTSNVQSDRLGALGRAVEAHMPTSGTRPTYVLKGSPSLVSDPAGGALLDCQGSSDLAAAGMGDALTGVCASLMAQGLSATDAGAVGLYLTGRGARLAGRGAALTPSDVIRFLPDAWRERGHGESDLDLPFVVFDADAAR